MKDQVSYTTMTTQEWRKKIEQLTDFKWNLTPSDYVWRFGAPKTYEWALKQPDPQALWNNCIRGDWMLWLLAQTDGGKIGTAERKKFAQAVCGCARLSFPYFREYADSIRIAVELTEAYCRGQTSLEIVEAAVVEAEDIVEAAGPEFGEDTIFDWDPAEACAIFAAAEAVRILKIEEIEEVADVAEQIALTAAKAAAYAEKAIPWYRRWNFRNSAEAATLKQCADKVRDYYPKAPLT